MEVDGDMEVGSIKIKSFSINTNTEPYIITDIKNYSEANALLHARPHLCDAHVAFRNSAAASSTAGPRRTRRSVQN